MTGCKFVCGSVCVKGRDSKLKSNTGIMDRPAITTRKTYNNRHPNTSAIQTGIGQSKNCKKGDIALRTYNHYETRGDEDLKVILQWEY